jgi:hypothetical protein
MSNVLIGIIGVILFIGLALAGALFLGPRFQEATISSKAAKTVQATAQVANAMSLYSTESGWSFSGQQPSVPELITAGYLKTNPGSISVYSFSTGTGIANTWLPETEEGRQMCWNIQRQTGQIAPGAEPDTAGKRYVTATFPKTSSGCMRHGLEDEPRMLAYSRY